MASGGAASWGIGAGGSTGWSAGAGGPAVVPNSGGLSGPLRVLTLDNLVLVEKLVGYERRQELRRLRTLLSLDTRKTRMGGNGKTLEVFDCQGNRLCLKALLPLDRHEKSVVQLNAENRGRTVAFDEEFRSQSVASGLAGFPQLWCRATYAGGPVMVMEWVDGLPLTQAFGGSGGRATALDCASVGLSVAGSLAQARRRDPQFVHRDVSPRNVFVRVDRVPLDVQRARHAYDTCLIDFGSAVCGSVREGAGAEPGGVVIWRGATAEYAPPEMFVHDDAHLAARLASTVDVYELCGVLYELWSGSTPFQLSRRGVSEPFRYKSCTRPGPLPTANEREAELAGIIMQGLSANPGARPSIEALASHLRSWIEGCGR